MRAPSRLPTRPGLRLAKGLQALVAVAFNSYRRHGRGRDVRLQRAAP